MYMFLRTSDCNDSIWQTTCGKCIEKTTSCIYMHINILTVASNRNVVGPPTSSWDPSPSRTSWYLLTTLPSWTQMVVLAYQVQRVFSWHLEPLPVLDSLARFELHHYCRPPSLHFQSLLGILISQNHLLLSLHSTGVDMHTLVKDKTYNNCSL